MMVSNVWLDWEDLGAIDGQPSVASWEAGRLDVFARGRNGGVSCKTFKDGRWETSWKDLGGTTQVIGTPAAVSWGNGRIDIFARWTDNKVHHTVWNGVKADAWDNLGGGTLESPAATSWKAHPGISEPGNRDRLYVFARGTEDHLWCRYWDGNWTAWEDVNKNNNFKLTSAPSAVSWAPRRIDCFATSGTDGHLHHVDWNGAWTAQWDDLGGQLTSAPAAASWGVNRLDVFARGIGNTMSRRFWLPGGWSVWQDMGGNLAGAPAAISWGPNRIDCFVMGNDNHLHHTVFTS